MFARAYSKYDIDTLFNNEQSKSTSRLDYFAGDKKVLVRN